jgi:hypothetical protein
VTPGSVSQTLTIATDLTPEVLKELHELFDEPVYNDDLARRKKAVRESVENAARIIVRNCPPSPDRSVAVRKLREVQAIAYWSIVHNGKF